jgi:hypothetical protein
MASAMIGYDGALTFPVAYEIGAGWEGAAMTVDRTGATRNAGRRAVWVNTDHVRARDRERTSAGSWNFASAAR